MSGHIEMLPGDCRDVLFDLAAEGMLFDACVTDPPYHLTSTVARFGKPGSAPAKSTGATGIYARASKGFMGKEWDGGDIAFQPETWRAVWETLKPGAHLAAFGGTRTYHRMGVAIENAGFEIRDTLMWLYGTGFPKSHDVSKGIDREHGAVREATGRRNNGIASGTGEFTAGNARSAGFKGEFDTYDTPATAAAAEWHGWGTALKPGWEPIILARKPLDRGCTVAGNVLRHRTGALNIDESRIPLAADDKLQDGVTHDGGALDTANRDGAGWGFKAVDRAPGLGRWPANVLHDGSDEVEAEFARYGETAGRARVGRRTGKDAGCLGAFAGQDDVAMGYSDSGTPSRFFYSTKATAADRDGSKHPTVKPQALMRWLTRLITPPGGRILDPFAGSGSTLAAAHAGGFYATGIELDPEYQADILRRIERLSHARGVACQATDDADMLAMLA